MLKKIIAMLLVLSMIAIAGCSKNEQTETQDEKENVKIDTMDEESAEEADAEDADAENSSVVEPSIFNDEPEEAELAESSDHQIDSSHSKPGVSGNKPGNNNNQQNSSGNQQDSSNSQPGESDNGDKDEDSSTTTPSGGAEESNPGNTVVDYESFQAMSPSKQQEYMESFDDIEKFFEWYNAEKEKYEKENPSIEVGDGSIDLDKIVNGN